MSPSLFAPALVLAGWSILGTMRIYVEPVALAALAIAVIIAAVAEARLIARYFKR